MSRTATEVEADIVIARAAIRAVAQVGQSYTINSGGSSRQVTNANIIDLKKWLADLQQELNDINEDGCLVIGASW